VTGDDGLRVPSAGYTRLRRLWDEHRVQAFPAAGTRDSRLQEVALYESWLGAIAEEALARGGRVGVAHRRMLQARQSERDSTLWSVAGELGEPVRSYLARLMAIEDALAALPEEG
jgi:hypothetical protein